MNKQLYQQLLKTALISSPIIGLYGITPVYVFNQVPPGFLLIAGIGIALNVFIFWMINIGIIKYSGTTNKWRWYIISYLSIILFHLLLILLRNILPSPAFLLKRDIPFEKEIMLAYPVISTLAINTIILIICNSVLVSLVSC